MHLKIFLGSSKVKFAHDRLTDVLIALNFQALLDWSSIRAVNVSDLKELCLVRRGPKIQS